MIIAKKTDDTINIIHKPQHNTRNFLHLSVKEAEELKNELEKLLNDQG